MIKIYRLLLVLISLLPYHAFAQGDDSKNKGAKDSLSSRFNLHFQTTYIYQYKPEFGAKYSGPNSLVTDEERQNSLTATLFLGVRLWQGAELYINPELAGGSGLSGAFGMGASTNGETFRVGNPAPTLYLARAYVKQTIALGGKSEPAEEGINQLNTLYAARSLSFYLGKFCLGDIFDNNEYAAGPRTSFLNWCFMNNGAWDYAANVRGYTYSFTTALQWDNMTYKAGLAALPITANGPELNTNPAQEYSINAEATRTHTWRKREGHIRLLAYYNSGHMGNYKKATENVPAGWQPDATLNRKYGRSKTGIGLNIDQEITDALGVFARAGWNDGQNETWCFTEVDRTISVVAILKGTAWKRKEDNAGFAVVANGISKAHRDYLNAGGLGFQLGDGRLSYAPETVAEFYYSFKPVSSGIWLTLDYQFGLNPGYNADRGPVNVVSFRAHVEL